MNKQIECPICGEMTDAKIIQSLGMCLRCDNARADELEEQKKDVSDLLNESAKEDYFSDCSQL